MLQGTNFDSVDHSEISVFIGGEPCNIEVPPSSEQVISQQSLLNLRRIETLQLAISKFFPTLQLFCLPPQEAPNGIHEAPILVCILCT